MADLIDRQAAIDALDKRFDSIPMKQTTEILLLRKDLRDLPPAERKTGRWIPCSERLPDSEVLCCDNHGEMMIGYVFACDDGETPYSAESEHEYMYDCVAWMPLPEPYQEGEQNEPEN